MVDAFDLRPKVKVVRHVNLGTPTGLYLLSLLQVFGFVGQKLIVFGFMDSLVYCG